MRTADLQRLVIYSRWVGFASPPFKAARLIIDRDATSFRRHRSPEEQIDQVSLDVMQEFLTALSQPLMKEVDFSLVGSAATEVRQNYGACWTDDYPGLLVEIQMTDGRRFSLQTETQHVFMLPFELCEGSQKMGETFDLRLSLAIAALMPDGFLGKNRLAGTNYWAPGLSDVAEPRDEVSTATTTRQKAALDPTDSLSRRLLKRLSVKELKDVLAQGGDPSIADEVGQTALMHAAFPPFDEVQFELLADAGADLEARRNDGLTGLHLACCGGGDPQALAWVRAGADIHSRTPDGSTPLMLGARWCRIVHLLLLAGANPNDVDNDGHSALCYVIIQQCGIDPERQLESIRALIAAGTVLNVRDHSGLTALGHACQVVARIEMESDVNRAFARAAECDPSNDLRLATEIVRMLVDAGGEK